MTFHNLVAVPQNMEYTVLLTGTGIQYSNYRISVHSTLLQEDDCKLD